MRAGRQTRWVVTAVLLGPALALASSGGIVGYSGLNAVSCSACHAPAAGATAPTATITGPATLNGAATGSYVLTITGGPGVRAGMNVSVNNANAVLAPGNTLSKNTAGELHHTSPIAFSGGQVQFPFTVKAPSSAGTIKLYAAVQSTNGAGTAGDRERLVTFDITVAVANAPPTVAQAANANPTTVSGTTTQVSVLGADNGGEANLTYTWSATGPAPVTFSPNGTNAAKASTATFAKAGSYQLTATLRDAANQTVTSTRTVTVNQTVTQVAVSPPSAGVPSGGTFQFGAVATDQFGGTLATAPAFTWTVSGGGTVGPGGLFTAAAAAGGPFTLTAAAGGKSGTASINVLSGNPPVILEAGAGKPNPVLDTTVALGAVATDDGGDANLTYTWTVANPPAPVTFSANGSYAARNTVVTFKKVGTYEVALTVTDKNNLTATQHLTVVVEGALAKFDVLPPHANVSVNGSQLFVVDARDQFGAPVATPVAWSASGGGHLNTSGVFRAGTSLGGPFEIVAATGTREAKASVTIASGTAPRVVELPVPERVFGQTAALSARGTDDGGESTLVYAWSATGPSEVSFSATGSYLARNTVATFGAAGRYVLAVTATNVGGLSTTETAELEVAQTPTHLEISPAQGRVTPSGTLLFTATPTDQFGHPITSSAAQVVWGVAGGGALGAEGLFTAGAEAGGPWVVSASSGELRSTAVLRVGSEGEDLHPPTVRLLAQDGEVLHARAVLRAEASDDVAVAQVRFFVDGEEVGRAERPSDDGVWQAPFDTWSWFNGRYTLEAVATDPSGNEGRPQPVQVEIANVRLTGAKGGLGCSAAGAAGALGVLPWLLLAVGLLRRRG